MNRKPPYRNLAVWVVVILFALLLHAMLPITSFAVPGFGVSPLRADLNVNPGSKSTFELTISNNSNQTRTFSLAVSDIHGNQSDPAGTPRIFEGKMDTSISGYDWIDVPKNISVAANGEAKFKVTITAPSDAEGGHYAAVVVTGASDKVEGITATSRVAVPFLLNAGGVLPPEIKITEIEESSKGTEVTYKNEGKKHTKPSGYVTYRDPITGKIIRRAKGSCTTALPGSKGLCFIPKESGKAGSDNSVNQDSVRPKGLLGIGPMGGDVELVTDEGTSARGKLPTEWGGVWTSALLPLVGIVFFILYFLFLRQRRKYAPALADRDAAEDSTYYE